MGFFQSSDPVRILKLKIDRTFVEQYGRGNRGDREFVFFRRQKKTDWLMNSVNKEILRDMRPNLKNNLNWNDLVEAVQDAEWLWLLYYKQSHYLGRSTKVNNKGRFKVDENGYAIVYTDGSCLKNGHQDAQAGIGVWFSKHHNLNLGAPLNNEDPATNNVAEIKAVVAAIEIVKSYGVERLAVHTDSQYLIDSVTNWIFDWLYNGWRKTDGKLVVHKQQYQELLMAMENMDIKWVHVEAHSHHAGNIEADRLARQGAQKYKK